MRFVNIALLLLIVIGIAVFFTAHDGLESDDIVIFTERIPVLLPHGHHTEDGDSILTTGHLNNVTSAPFEIEEDTWINGLELILLNAPQATVHHIFLYNNDTKDALCPKRPELLMAMSAESESSISLRKPYGVFLPQGTTVSVVAMFHNPEPPIGSGETYENVRAGFKLKKVGDTAEALKPLTFYLAMLSDRPYCTTNTFAVPENTEQFVRASDINEDSPSYFTFQKPGTIVGMGPHLHPWEGGKKVDAFLNKELIASFVPILISHSPAQWHATAIDTDIRVKKDDTLTLTSEYENHHDIPITGAMGMLGFYVAYDE